MFGFSFGTNWKAFSERELCVQQLNDASRSVKTLLEIESLKDLSFLDVGCGSGLFSLAAYELGAKRIVGIDIDPMCISVSEQNRNKFIPSAPIEFIEGSALDQERLKSLGEFDIVYAWGSLHHTGEMYEAIKAVSRQVAAGGTYVLAIYNRHVTSRIWRFIKWLYNKLPPFGQEIMAFLFFIVIFFAKYLITHKNPLIKERGMNFWRDVIDWIGGYPYEYASPQEIEEYLTKQGFVLRRFVKAQVPTGCNEYIFQKQILY
jgi:ubiquinone/menaquinone biosynthesis C-methylase UbiE